MPKDGIYFQCIDIKFFMFYNEVFAFIVENIMSLRYTPTPGQTFKISKV